MRKLLHGSGIGFGLALLTPAALAARLLEVQTFVGTVVLYAVLLLQDQIRAVQGLIDLAARS